MTYKELQINSEIELKEKEDDKRASPMIVKYTVVAKYPNMCIIENLKGRRRGVAVGELVMNKIITQEPVFESLRKEGSGAKASRGWHKKGRAEYCGICTVIKMPKKIRGYKRCRSATM